MIGHVLSEMAEMASLGHDCWLKRVTDIEKLLKLSSQPSTTIKPRKGIAKSKLRSIFDIYWLKKLNEIKLTRGDGLNHNKLRVYSQFKGSFKMEPYIHLIRNRNQRSFLTRLRISAHSLATEIGRRSRPVIPFDKRICSFCTPESNCLPNQTGSAFLGYVDSEAHFLTQCTRFSTTRKHFYSKIVED